MNGPVSPLPAHSSSKVHNSVKSLEIETAVPTVFTNGFFDKRYYGRTMVAGTGLTDIKSAFL